MLRKRQPEITRKRILRAAFDEFRRHGYATADLDALLQAAGVTRGALYHHFHSKEGLGLAVVEEVLRDWVLDRWLHPVAQAVDPVAALIDLARWGERTANTEHLSLGSPLLSLAQELSALNELFRRRLALIYDQWRAGLQQALEEAQRRGLIDGTVDCGAAASFVVAAWEGTAGLTRCDRSPETLRQCRQGLERFLQSLRPSHPA